MNWQAAYLNKAITLYPSGSFIKSLELIALGFLCSLIYYGYRWGQVLEALMVVLFHAIAGILRRIKPIYNS